MNITRETIKSTLRTIMAEETEYQTFFKKALEKAGKSIPSMSDEEKKEFFNKIDAAWNAKGEKKEVTEVHLREGMKKWKVDFKHTDGSKRTVDIEAFDKKRAEARFKVNWGNDMKILKIYPAPKNEELKGNQHKLDVDGDGEIEASDLAALRAGKKKEESVNESAGCGCGCGCGGSKMNEEFKSKDSTFEKVYGIFDKRDYFNAKGLAKVQIGNFERALQKNDKGAQQILDKFKGDMDKAKDYIIQVITDRKKEDAFNQYKAFKVAVDSIQKGKPIYGAVDLVKSRIHNNSQKYTMALYSAIRNQKFNKWKDIHADVDSLIGESVNEARLGKVAMLKDVEAGRTSSVEGVKISKDLAFEMRMFLQRPMLSRSRTGIAIDNSQMKEAIPMLAKVGIHKRLSSGVKKEFAELLKKYK